MENFVTLFDSNFLPMGLCLNESLELHAGSYHLWVVCMDKNVYAQLINLNISNLTPVFIEDVEDERLRSVKPSRTKGEYCWTVTPFTPEIVFRLAPNVDRVTYLDADVFLFNSPKPFFDEFEHSQKHVLITEHAYSPEYEFRGKDSGRFCVQFMTFRRTEDAMEVMHWWQDRCIEWCFARFEPGRFGDQKYLDEWPEIFRNQVHILAQTQLTLAPWNVKYMFKISGGVIMPVIYHFHSLRILSPCNIKLFESYRIGKPALVLYQQYLAVLRTKVVLMEKHGISVPTLPEARGWRLWLRSLHGQLVGKRAVIQINF